MENLNKNQEVVNDSKLKEEQEITIYGYKVNGITYWSSNLDFVKLRAYHFNTSYLTETH